MQLSSLEITMGIRSDLSQVAMVGKSLSSLLNNSGMATDKIALFELAVVEVVTNSIEHAYDFDKGFKIDLLLRVSHDSVVVTVTDYGAPMPPEVVQKYTTGKAGAVLQSPEVKDEGDIMSLPEGGWGTSLVGMLCDDVNYKHHKTSNIMTLTCEIPSAVDQAV